MTLPVGASILLPDRLQIARVLFAEDAGALADPMGVVGDLHPMGGVLLEAAPDGGLRARHDCSWIPTVVRMSGWRCGASFTGLARVRNASGMSSSSRTVTSGTIGSSQSST